MTNKEQKCVHRNFLNLYNTTEHTMLKQYPFAKNDEKQKAVIDALYYIDVLCETFEKESILQKMNEFQTEVAYWLEEDTFRKSVFAEKGTIPLYFINLYLKDMNLVLEEE